MSANTRRIREQAVVYLADRDRALLDDLARETGLSRTELFRRGLWALAEQFRTPKRESAMEMLIAMSNDVSGPSDLSEHADDYLYGGGYEAIESRADKVAESANESKRPARKRGSGRGARSR